VTTRLGTGKRQTFFYSVRRTGNSPIHVCRLYNVHGYEVIKRYNLFPSILLNELRIVTFKTFFFPSVQLFLRLKVGNIYANVQMHV
jgi:hypothetical protein